VSVPRAQSSLGRRLAIAGTIVVVGAVVASVWVTGSPSAQRAARLDARRVNDLDDIKDAIRRHVDDHGALPASLAALAREPGIHLSIADPVTGTIYEFAVTGPRSYRLCASFSTDTALQAPSDYLANDARWAHGIGRRCFERTAATASGLPSD
jgi:hypothetical protein